MSTGRFGKWHSNMRQYFYGCQIVIILMLLFTYVFLKERGMIRSRYLSRPHTIDFDMSDTMSANLSVSELVNSIMHMCLQHHCRRQSRQQRCKFSRKVCRAQTRRRRNWCTNSDMCIRIYHSIRWRSRQTNGCVLFVCTTTNSPDRSLIKINSLAQFILY